MTKVYIYSGDSKFTGVDYQSAHQVEERFKEIDSSIEVSMVTAVLLESLICPSPHQKSGWEKRCIVVFPGGVASAWDSQLGDTVHTLRSFVERGGNALMICAGAYFSAEESLFQIDEENSIYRRRPLKFFSGIVKGPLSFQSGSLVKIKSEMDGSAGNVFYAKGGHFIPKDANSEDYITLSRYADDKIASLLTKVGLGKVVMTFVHYEFDGVKTCGKTNDSIHNTKIKLLNEKLLQGKNFRSNFFKDILHHFCLYNPSPALRPLLA